MNLMKRPIAFMLKHQQQYNLAHTMFMKWSVREDIFRVHFLFSLVVGISTMIFNSR